MSGLVRKRDDSYSLSQQNRPSNAFSKLWDSLLVPAQVTESQCGLLSETRRVQCFWKTKAEPGTFLVPKMSCNFTLVEWVILLLCDILSTPCFWLSVHFVTDMLNSIYFTLFWTDASYIGLKQHVMSWILSFVLCPTYSFLLVLEVFYISPRSCSLATIPFGKVDGGGGQSKWGCAGGVIT